MLNAGPARLAVSCMRFGLLGGPAGAVELAGVSSRPRQFVQAVKLLTSQDTYSDGGGVAASVDRTHTHTGRRAGLRLSRGITQWRSRRVSRWCSEHVDGVRSKMIKMSMGWAGHMSIDPTTRHLITLLVLQFREGLAWPGINWCSRESSLVWARDGIEPTSARSLPGPPPV